MKRERSRQRESPVLREEGTLNRKCLVIYSSYTGNTEKIALRFKDTFEREGWQCDIFKIGKKAGDILNPPFRMNDSISSVPAPG